MVNGPAKVCEVVATAYEIVGLVPPLERSGYVALTAETPPADVVVAMIFPFGSTARIVPAGVPREVSHTVEEAVNIVDDALP
jgi:hypothetical protein